MKVVNVCVLALALLIPMPLAAQTVTSAELLRLQDNIAEISKDLTTVRARNPTVANELQTELNNASDDAAYLRVKLRRNEVVSRAEYLELLDRIDNIRAKTRDEAKPSARIAPRAADVPAGTEFDVKLTKALSSATASVEDAFEATTLVDLVSGSRTIVPAGSVMRGTVSAVHRAGRIDRKGSLRLSFDRITIRHTSYVILATVTQTIESEGIRSDAGKIGAGAGVGAVIGGILGGFKGAVAGVLVGGGGVIAATEGSDVELPAGSVLRVKLDSGLSLE